MVMRDIDTDAAQAHEMFQSFEGMEGLPVSVASAPKPRLGIEGYARRIYPGVLVARHRANLSRVGLRRVP